MTVVKPYVVEGMTVVKRYLAVKGITVAVHVICTLPVVRRNGAAKLIPNFVACF